MKITVYYEDRYDKTTIEVPDEDCEIWVEQDYQRRLEEAEDKTAVARRTPQEIMDEDYNKPTFNSHQRETRRHVSFEALDPEGDKIDSGEDITDSIIHDEEMQALHRAIDKLEPQQKELLRKVFFEGVKPIDIAREEGIGRDAVSKRLSRIYSSLKKILEKK